MSFTAVRRSLDYVKRDVETRKSNACDEAHFAREHYVIPSQGNVDESGDTLDKKFNKAIKVAEVQTQTVNDMATQTDTSCVDKRNAQNVLSKIHEDPYVGRSFVGKNEEVPQLSLDSAEQFEGLDQIEEISLPRIGTMSEISLHETTSSIKTETGTEISISTRDITCSFMSKEFNKYLNLEVNIFHWIHTSICVCLLCVHILIGYSTVLYFSFSFFIFFFIDREANKRRG